MRSTSREMGSTSNFPEIDRLIEGLAGGDRRTLARAITLCESLRPADREHAEALLEAVLARSGGSIRVGVTGSPGVGKSTLIERLGLRLIERGHRISVLAIDPTSLRTGGSLLGDKTRMEELCRAEGVFVRPSPSGSTVGGIAARTREAMILCEAAGTDVVIVETVGVGQSEHALAGLVDTFVLLIPADTGFRSRE